jgi:hypothetical protein
VRQQLAGPVECGQETHSYSGRRQLPGTLTPPSATAANTATTASTQLTALEPKPADARYVPVYQVERAPSRTAARLKGST